MAALETAVAAASVAKGLFGSKGSAPDVSSATSGGAYLNSSGWVVGRGNAQGGGFPWQILLFGGLAVYAVLEFKKLRGSHGVK